MLTDEQMFQLLSAKLTAREGTVNPTEYMTADVTVESLYGCIRLSSFWKNPR